jgi:hypothetical protein
MNFKATGSNVGGGRRVVISSVLHLGASQLTEQMKCTVGAAPVHMRYASNV